MHRTESLQVARPHSAIADMVLLVAAYNYRVTLLPFHAG